MDAVFSLLATFWYFVSAEQLRPVWLALAALAIVFFLLAIFGGGDVE